MQRRSYDAPTMQVIEIQHSQMIMDSGQGVQSVRSNYASGNEKVASDQKNEKGIWIWN